LKKKLLFDKKIVSKGHFPDYFWILLTLPVVLGVRTFDISNASELTYIGIAAASLMILSSGYQIVETFVISRIYKMLESTKYNFLGIRE
jgi:hypothetical protein